MKRATITETKNNLSSLLDLVRQGETIVILDRNRPIARIEPMYDDTEGRLARLERAGVLKRRKKKGPCKLILTTPPPKAIPGASIVDAVISERSAGH